MKKKLECTVYDNKSKQNKVVGFMELNNEDDSPNTELYLYGDIVSDQWGKWSDDDTCPQDVSDFLKELDKSNDIDVYINSGGGAVYGGLAIYNQLKRHNGQVTVHVDGIAASIASVIACAGDRIIVPKPSQFMIHKPSVCFFWTSLNADELRKQADNLDVCQESIMSVYMDNVQDGVTRETIEELVNNETWLTGETIAQYFNFEVEESAEAVAHTSIYYENYKNVPKDLKKSFFNVQNHQKTTPVMDKETREMIERVKNKTQEWGL